MRILIVEDDKMLGNGLKAILQLQKYDAYLTGSLAEGKEFFSRQEPDLCILDLWLPDGNGFELCRWIRERSGIPVLFLTACEDVSKMVEGLKCGGDDYVVKPFHTQVLLARIEALLRRRQPSGKEDRTQSGYRSGNVSFDAEERVCRFGDRTLQIPVEEWKILWCLLSAEGRMVTKEQIRQAVWENGAEHVEENTIRVVVSRLRHRLEEIGLPGAVGTRRGLGYCWTLPVEKC